MTVDQLQLLMGRKPLNQAISAAENRNVMATTTAGETFRAAVCRVRVTTGQSLDTKPFPNDVLHGKICQVYVSNIHTLY